MRRACAVLALIGSLVGLMRAAFPVVAHHPTGSKVSASIEASANPGTDESAPSIGHGRPIRTGARRPLVILIGLTRDSEDGKGTDGSSLVSGVRERKAPANVDPAPPFHPPRVI